MAYNPHRWPITVKKPSNNAASEHLEEVAIIILNYFRFNLDKAGSGGIFVLKVVNLLQEAGNVKKESGSVHHCMYRNTVIVRMW